MCCIEVTLCFRSNSAYLLNTNSLSYGAEKTSLLPGSKHKADEKEKL